MGLPVLFHMKTTKYEKGHAEYCSSWHADEFNICLWGLKIIVNFRNFTGLKK